MRGTAIRRLGTALGRLTGLAVIVSVCILGATATQAAPMNGESVDIQQPDGTSLQVRVWGDEYFAHGETMDGYTVTRDESSGFLCYARLTEDGQDLISTGVPGSESPPFGLEKHIRIAQDAAREKAYRSREEFEHRQLTTLSSPVRSGRPGTTTGEVVGITLIVDFSDDPATIPAANFDDYCNLPGYTGYGNNGSVRDYYYDVSEELLTYTNYVSPQYYRAQNTKAYYTNPSAPYGQRAQELVAEALADLDASGFDFSQYDSNGDGIVDAVNCFYAGNTWNNWAEGLWPHAGWLEWCADGVCTQRYQITDAGNQLSLGTFCHENGHMLMGWPDLYDYGGDSAGVGAYCLMCAGCFGTNPNEPCGHLKLDAGWGDVTELWEPIVGLTVSIDGNDMYRFGRPGHPNEYFLIENRQPTGRDAGLPDAGLAIWHIDTEGSNNNQQQTPELHYLVTLVQADGDWDLENNRNNGDGSDL
ncbi:M6 family metalloprotease domain-containing protein, partial [bacterium]|nr:M6 family metalloprotease domain-containing protein [bacterium]